MTVKKFIALTSAALAAVAITASAQVAVDVTSAYVFRGGTINDDVNVQPGFDTTLFNGFYYRRYLGKLQHRQFSVR